MWRRNDGKNPRWPRIPDVCFSGSNRGSFIARLIYIPGRGERMRFGVEKEAMQERIANGQPGGIGFFLNRRGLSGWKKPLAFGWPEDINGRSRVVACLGIFTESKLQSTGGYLTSGGAVKTPFFRSGESSALMHQSEHRS